jgi:hypothetical protein
LADERGCEGRTCAMEKNVAVLETFTEEWER